MNISVPAGWEMDTAGNMIYVGPTWPTNPAPVINQETNAFIYQTTDVVDDEDFEDLIESYLY